MFSKIIISTVLISGMAAFNHPHEAKEKTVSESFLIDEVDHNDVIGEPLHGTGEGINYTKSQFEKAGVHNVKIGDKVTVTWSKKDYDNCNWNKMTMHRIK